MAVLACSRAIFTASARAYAACERALAAEAGWTPPDGGLSWFAVDVEVDRRGRPIRVDAGPKCRAVPVEVFGSVVGLPRNERGFRARTATGGELMLVREAGNTWYADEDLEALDPRETDSV